VINRSRLLTLALLSAWLLSFAAYAAEQSPEIEEMIAIPNHGSLVLRYPSAWQMKMKEARWGRPPTIRLADEKIILMIAPAWNIDPFNDITQQAEIYDVVEKMGRGMLPYSMERQLFIKDFGTDEKTGYYFFLTYKAPKNEFKYLVQGAISEGDLALTFSYLTNSKDPQELSFILNMLATIQQR
jgi:hypothetical protein